MHIVLNTLLFNLFIRKQKIININIYLNAIKLSIPLAVAKISAKIHITMAPILKQLLLACPPAPIVSEPAIMMKIPDHNPPLASEPHQLEATAIMIIPNNSVIIPMVRIAIPENKKKSLRFVFIFILSISLFS